MLQIKGISKRYGQLQVLFPIDLHIKRGECLVLVGQSGCGKSTLIRMLVGLVTPDSGEIFLDNTKYSDHNMAMLRRKMGYVIQTGGLFPHLTAEANATLPAKHIGWNKSRINTRLKDLLELAHFPKKRLSHYPVQLSGGERQRVALMRSLMLDPEIIFLDEPLGALDPLMRRNMQEELRELFKHLKKTVVLVTHDVAEAGFFGDRIALMKEGKVLQLGTLEALMHKPEHEYVESFIRSQRNSLVSSMQDVV